MAKESLSDVVDRILTMRKVETSYCLQYFVQTACQEKQLAPLSESWRTKVAQWAFNVVDHFGLSRETVAVSMNIFDRYVATQGNKISGNMVLLTSLTTLHIAIKMLETQRIKASVLANLSRDQFTVSHIEEMELKIFSALSWKLHLPTPLAFISEFLHLLPPEVTSSEQREVYELSKYLTELAVCESSFVERQNSVIAIAAIRIIMERMNFIDLNQEANEKFVLAVSEIMGQTSESETTRDTRERLQIMFSKIALCNSFHAAYGGHSQSAKIVSPCIGSPLSMESKSFDVVSVHDGCSERKTNFWYTPSPPPSTYAVGARQIAPICQ